MPLVFIAFAATVQPQVKSMISTFQLVAQCLNQLRNRVPRNGRYGRKNILCWWDACIETLLLVACSVFLEICKNYHAIIWWGLGTNKLPLDNILKFATNAMLGNTVLSNITRPSVLHDAWLPIGFGHEAAQAVRYGNFSRCAASQPHIGPVWSWSLQSVCCIGSRVEFKSARYYTV
jgi:hypothetical protein